MHSRILTWKIPQIEDWQFTVHRIAESDMTEHNHNIKLKYERH